MPIELMILIYGISGGLIGTAISIGIFYFHVTYRFRNYFFNKEHFKTRMKVTELEDDVNQLKIQMGHVNSELYHRAVEDEYK